jgi:hypothetical protein
MLSGVVDIRPALPSGCRWISAPVRLGAGTLFVLHYADEPGVNACSRLVLSEESEPVTIRYAPMIPPGTDIQKSIEPVEFELKPGESVELVVKKGKGGWSSRVASPEERPVCRSNNT